MTDWPTFGTDRLKPHPNRVPRPKGYSCPNYVYGYLEGI